MMTNIEIALARSYLAKSSQDPVGALIRSVRDLARLRALMSARHGIDGAASALPGRTLAQVGRPASD